MRLNNITARLNETALETLIKDAVHAKTGLKVASVSFNIGSRITGYGMNETSEHYFEDVVVTFENGQDIRHNDIEKE